MTYTGAILALDLARVAGFACGRPGETPVHGSVMFAKDGASMAAVLHGCRSWLRSYLIANPQIQLIVFEAPLLASFKRGKTTNATTRQLIGLCAVVEELLYSLTGYDVREAMVVRVRSHFIGSNPKRARAKAMTVAMCRMRGWDPEDDNAADALALWDYQCSFVGG